MPRHARIHGDTDIYHIMMRGNEKKKIFLECSDRKRFIEILFEKTSEEKSDLYAYCLMDNHIHLLLQKDGMELARLMKRINVSFAYYFNKKYKRVGHLFQDRFVSEIVDTEEYLLAAVRYIHNNPVKAGIVSSPEKYLWSSYNDYLGVKNPNKLKTDTVLDIFSDNKTNATKLFIEFGSLDSDIKFIEFIEKSNEELRFEKEKQAKKFLGEILKSKDLSIEDLYKKENHHIRNEIILELKIRFDLSSRQMASIMNISKGTILKIYKENGQ